MIKRISLFIFLLVCIQAFPQNKNTFSVGGGTEGLNNSFLSPYNMDGNKFINVLYDKEKLLNGNWKSLFDINIGASSLWLDYNFANKVENGPVSVDISASVNKMYLLKLFENNSFNLHAGFVGSLQSEYQAVTYTPVVYSDYVFYVFFRVAASAGIATSAQLRLKKIIFSNTSSYHLLNAMLYPNYSNDLPLVSGISKEYWAFSSIGRRVYLSNKLRAEFPLYIKDRFINSFAVSYLFHYENSNIKDILYKKTEHVLSLGIIFDVTKLNVLSKRAAPEKN